MNEKIFIAIPSANDPQLFETISRAIDNAENPKNLTIAFSTQYSDKKFKDFFGIDVTNCKKIINTKGAKVIHLNMTDKFQSGVCVTRNKLTSLLTDEKYFLSVDAHTSFAKKWDKSFITEYKKMKSYFDKPIITGYIGNSVRVKKDKSEITNPEILNDRSLCNLFNKEYLFDDYRTGYTKFTLNKDHCELQIISSSNIFKNRYKVNISEDYSFILIQHLTAHHFFVESSWIKEVNWPLYIKFYGEEQDLSLRSFLAGYDMVSSSRKYISDMGEWASNKDKSFIKYLLSDGTQELAKLFFSGKNNYYDFTDSKRKPIDWLISNYLVNSNTENNIVTDEFDWIKEF